MRSDMLQHILNAFCKFSIAGHALWMGFACHPLLQGGSQQAEMVLVHLGRIGFGQRHGMHRLNQGMAVVLVQRRPNFWRHVQFGTFSNALPSLTVPFQAAHQHGVETQSIRSMR